MDVTSRAIFRGQITKLTNAATEYLSKPESRIIARNSENFDQIEEELAAFSQRLTAARDSLNSANEQVRNAIKQEDLPRELETIAEYEDKAITVIARLNQRLKRLQAFDGNLYPINVQPTNSSVKSASKLPKLKLKFFSGDFMEWLPFWELFRTAVHEQENLSAVDKFNYLQAHLTGKAAESIAGFTPTEANYDAAIAMLREEYGDNEKLVDYSIQQLMALPRVNSRHDHHSLRQLYNKVNTATRSLTALNVAPTHYSVMLKSMLLRCIPKDLSVDFHRTHLHQGNLDNDSANKEDDVKSSIAGSESSIGYNGDIHIRNLLKFLKREVESLEKSAAIQPPQVKSSTSTGMNNKTSNFRTAAGLLNTTPQSIDCFFCKRSDHGTDRCNSPLSLFQRKELLKQDRRCFRCTRKGHNSRNCLNRRIKCDTCQGNHATSLCDPHYRAILAKNNNKNNNKTARPESETNNSPTNLLSAASLCSSCRLPPSSKVYLQTACAFVSSASPVSNPMLFARIVIDGGSQRSYITQTLANKLNLEEFDTVKMRILPFGSVNNKPPMSFSRVRVKLTSQHDHQCVVIVAVVVPEICLDVLPVPDENCDKFSQICLADAQSKANELLPGINMLIGADCYWQIVLLESKRISENLTAINTILGWTIHGPAGDSCLNEELCLTAPTIALNVNIVDCTEIRRFWDLECLGISSIDSSEIRDIKFEDYITRQPARYEARLLWRKPDCVLESYRNGALVRFNKLVQKLSRQPEKFFEYDDAMRQLIHEGVVERVNKPQNSDCRIYYLPHRPIYREDKTTTKMRIVFDASARSGNALSLNDNLSTGPNLLPNILAILLNFRLGKIGIVADIEKAFLQIALNQNDRNVHRFFWFEENIKNLDQLPPPAEFRMTRVTFGVACSPFLLCATLRKHFESESSIFPNTCELLRQFFYMDDLVLSMDNNVDAERTYNEAILILRRASMNIRKWNTNDSRLRKILSLSNKLMDIQKVLGTMWYLQTDELGVDLQQLPGSAISNATKRIVLQLIARIYDPLGILGPFVIKLKILFQDLWRLKVGWDELLPNSMQTVWNSCVANLNILNEITVPRCLFNSSKRRSQQLHVFADASMQAYGTVAYIRSVNEDQSVHVMYLCSKNRVAPLRSDNSKELTLPKLELTAALIAARLTKFIHENIKVKFEATYLWSDSKITLHWINGDDRKWQPYVAHRIREIHQIAIPLNWRHCPGNENPADLLTRGVNGRKLLSSVNWLQGPGWLSNEPDTWPALENISNNVVPLLCLQVSTNSKTYCQYEQLFDLTKFSKYRRVLRITAYVQRFLRRTEGKKRRFLTAEELRRAETYWIKFVQGNVFEEEISALQNEKQIRSSSKILTLNPFLDENNILRVRSRLQEAQFDFNQTFPIILPKSTYFTKLLVSDMHERTLHGGVNIVLARLRENFWIIKARQLVKSIIGSCKVCRMLRGKPAMQPFAPLPKERLYASRPFETTGIDFAGPLYVKTSSNNNDTSKMYIFLATCAVVRAVHLELVPSLHAESCLLALRRFFARRGIPKTIISDNALTFKRASLELREFGNFIESESVQGYAANQGIRWKFIVERAPWWGGFYERLVKSVKDVLKSTIGRAALTVDQLQTFLIEAEFVVNSRPLTYISNDPLDLSPLTPIHFLIGIFSNQIAESQSTSDDLRKKWKSRLRLTNLFFNRWRTEYIQRLRSAHTGPQQFFSDLKKGDVVLVYDQKQPRLLWKLAVIEEIYPGRDGKVRACEVRFSNGSRLRRPTQLLYPLEISPYSSRAGGC